MPDVKMSITPPDTEDYRRANTQSFRAHSAHHEKAHADQNVVIERGRGRTPRSTVPQGLRAVQRARAAGS